MIEDVPTYGVRRGGLLCLSGGGFRAALFHLGALTRLNELGLLAQTETIGAVAGGSILAALLATRVPWPLAGAFRQWPEQVSEPLREITRRNARARARLRSPLRGGAGDSALEERQARELIEAGPPRAAEPPRVVLGAAGLALGELTGADREEPGLRWAIDDSAARGYDPLLVEDVIATVREDLDAFGEAEQAVLENHGYLLADAAVRAGLPQRVRGVEPLPPAPPHPRWMNEERVRDALAASSRRTRLGRLRPRRAATRAAASDATGPEVSRLLERHRPLIRYDSLESFRADSVETIVGLTMGRRCNSLHRADGTPIAAALPAAGSGLARLDLDFLGAAAYADGTPARADDYLEESGGSHAADALAMRRRQGCADVVYGRACRDRDGGLWLQYWLFFYFDDKGFLETGRHEGDWELLQLLVGADGEPQEATFGQHGGGASLAWQRVERHAGEGFEAPVVYCARGSHACLPAAGTWEAPLVPDHNDGLGPAVRPRLVEIGEGGPGWALWPGRWGSTRRREAFEGESPRGPGCRPGWRDPRGLHREARPAEEGRWRGAPPPAPRLVARREGECAIVTYEFPAPAGAGERPERLVAAAHREGEREPPRTQAFRVEGERGSFALPLPVHAEFEAVRVSVSSELGGAGSTLTVPIEA